MNRSSKDILERPGWSMNRALYKAMGYSDYDPKRPLEGHPMTTVSVIADDLTGAADTGVQFCGQGAEVILTDSVTPVGRRDSSDVSLALYTRTRAADAPTARRKLYEVGKKLGFRQRDVAYKKIDSCLRGNIGAETEALMEALGFEASFIAPAFPAMGRTTVHDIHRIGGTPIAETEIARDPVTPVLDSRLSRNVGRQARWPVARVDIQYLEAPWRALVRKTADLLERGARHLVFDAVTQAHLDIIARLVRSLPNRILPVGSAGLAAGLSREQAGQNRSYGDRPVRQLFRLKGPSLLVCGSASRQSRRQIDVLAAECAWQVITIPPRRLDSAEQRRRIVRQAAAMLSRRHLAIRLAPPAAYENSAQLTPKALCRHLGRLSVRIMQQVLPAGLLATGGDTADIVFKEMRVRGMLLHGEMLTGMVAGVLLGGPFEGLRTITKAGAFGADTALLDLFRIWQAGSPAKAGYGHSPHS